jgi:outer membrane protein OmpA-like peptidoglycan-associated protein
VGAGPRYTKGFETADVRAMIGFLFEPPIGDRDGDGIKDDVDACPTKYGQRSNDPEKNGCPADTDEDGAPDNEDACPYVKGVITRDAITNGCPPERPPLPDRDKDGFPDVEDACPNDYGFRHSDPSQNGCPDILVGEVEITLFDKILFKTASAEILPESNPILDKVAKALNDHPEITLIEVGGHADERGAEKMNLALTQARVESVVAALVTRSVAPTRLRAKGYGFYCPIDSDHDESAWGKNRRVEFKIVKTVRGATGVDLGCENARAHGVTPAPVP